MIAYFADKDVISPKVGRRHNEKILSDQLKSDVATGLLAFVKH